MSVPRRYDPVSERHGHSGEWCPPCYNAGMAERSAQIALLDHLDPDPLDPAVARAYSVGVCDGWDAAVRSTPALSVEGLAALLIAALSGALVGAALMWVVR